MENEEWSEALDTCKAVSPKLSDRLTQIYILQYIDRTSHLSECPGLKGITPTPA